MTLTVVDQPFVSFPLSQTLCSGQSVVVHATGVNNGTAGLRSWLIDGAQSTNSNVVTAYVGTSLPSGSFTLDYTLTVLADKTAGFLFIKGPVYGTNIDNIIISTITVTYSS